MPTPQHPDEWARLARYVSGACTPEERVAIEAWIIEDERRGRIVDELQGIWIGTERSPAGRDVPRAWARLRSRLEAPAARAPRPQPPPAPSESRHPRPLLPPTRRSRWAPLASVVGLCAILALAIWGAVAAGAIDEPATATAPLERAFAAQHGERADVVLRDGTRVRLNVGSTLRVPASFGEGERRVALEGEAFFDVMPDADRPFVIDMGAATVHVIGTAFNVRAYADEAAEVYVTEGAVTLAGTAAPADTLVLRPRHLGVASAHELYALRGAPGTDRLAWLDGQLVFRETPFADVVAELERWYDLDIQLRLPADAVVPLTSTFSGEPLSEILRSIAATLGLRFKRDRRSITFYAAEPGR